MSSQTLAEVVDQANDANLDVEFEVCDWRGSMNLVGVPTHFQVTMYPHGQADAIAQSPSAILGHETLYVMGDLNPKLIPALTLMARIALAKALKAL